MLSVSLLFLSYVALPSVELSLALGAHSCWSNIRLAAEWRAVTNTGAIILRLRCRVLSEQQTAVLTRLATCCISTVQGRFPGSEHEARAKSTLTLNDTSMSLRLALFWGDHRRVLVHGSGYMEQGSALICISPCSRLERTVASPPVVVVTHL